VPHISELYQNQRAAAEARYGKQNIYGMRFHYLYGWLPVMSNLPDFGPGTPPWESLSDVTDRLSLEPSLLGQLLDERRVALCISVKTEEFFIRFTGGALDDASHSSI